jgi:hypothetical protein
MTLPLRISGLICLVALAAAGAAEPYTFLWWAYGWRGEAPDGRRVLHVQTNRYGAAFDVQKPALLHLGPLANPAPYAAAVEQPNEVVTALPGATLRLTATVDDVLYTCTGAADRRDDRANYPVRIVESGRFLQRFDILHLEFTSAFGERLEIEARLEVVAWPDRLHFLLDVTPARDNLAGVVALELAQGDRVLREERPLGPSTDAVLVPLIWNVLENQPEHTANTVVVTDARAQHAKLPVTYDAARGWYYVDLPERSWDVAEEPDRLDRFGVELTNDGDVAKSFRLLFAFDDAFPGVTGMCPMLRDSQGRPTGIPVQISKNWHKLQDRPFLYEGPWFHGASVVTVPPGERWQGEFAITYARWGGVPAASHAQLCLIGWGTNQLWDQAAIGSWGESICYDPDVNLERAMIDDMRPLMVTGMNGGLWNWTHNVGGGDFLVYFDENGRKQFLTRMRTAYLAHGPNLTEVVYAGVTADGKISARITVSTPRCDDVNRAYHRVRYDVLETTPFSRLAFYQVGADNYNDHQFTGMARGNRDGLSEEWETERGGKRYLRTAMVCEGDAPWFSLHGGVRTERFARGAWANRGLVVRAWQARLGGQNVAHPFAAVYGTEDGVPSANIQIVPPPGLTQLEPGDFVEAEFELLVVPAAAEDYYGPNEALRAHLEHHAGTWRVIHRLARENHLEVTMRHGTLTRRLPIIVAVGEGEQATFEVTGGAGYVPITFTGLRRPFGYTLERDGAAVDQHIHGNDFWQTDYDPAAGTYSQTYNIPLDTSPRRPNVAAIRFYPVQ